MSKPTLLSTHAYKQKYGDAIPSYHNIVKQIALLDHEVNERGCPLIHDTPKNLESCKSMERPTRGRRKK